MSFLRKPFGGSKKQDADVEILTTLIVLMKSQPSQYVEKIRAYLKSLSSSDLLDASSLCDNYLADEDTTSDSRLAMVEIRKVLQLEIDDRE